MINSCWFTLKWGLLLAAVGALVAVPYLYHRIDDEICRHVQALFAKQYPHLAVSVRSAHLVDGEGIEIRGLSIFEPGATGPRAELVYMDEVFVFCKTDLKDLISAKVDITHFVIRRPTLRVTRRADGSWSTARLLPLPKLSDSPPQATIENGVVEIFDPLRNPSATLTLRELNLKISPVETPQGWQSSRGALRVQGHTSGDYVRQIEIDGVVDPNGKAWQFGGMAEGLDVSPELCRSMPGDQPEKLVALEGVRAQARARFRVTYNAAVKPAFDYEISGQIRSGRVDDPRLPYPLTDLRANFASTPRGVSLSDLTARSGSTLLRLDADRQGQSADSPIRVKATAQHLVLDNRLLDSLPASWQAEWHKFLPSGEIDLSGTLVFDGKKWTPDVSAKCLNVAFTYHKFPFRLEHSRGTIDLKGDSLKINLLASSESAETRIVGDLQLVPKSTPLGWVEVRADNLRLDDKLLQALPQKPSEIVRSLNPYGTCNLFYRQWQVPEPQPVSHQYALISLNRCSIKYSKFPLQLDGIRGTLEMRDQVWAFRDLEGVNGTGHISCSGHLIPRPGGSELFLRFLGANVALDEELRDALNPGAQQLWNDLRPHGTVALETELRSLPGEPAPQLWVRAEPLGDSVSIEPVHFPYRLEKVRGVFVFSGGRVTLDHVKAEHGRTALATRGYCDVRPESGWDLHLEALTVDRLRADRDLLQAVPERLKKIVGDLHVTGQVNLRGNFDLSSRGTPGEPLSSRWNVNLDLHQSSLTAGIKLDNVNGGVNLVGDFDGRQFRCQGEVALDSLTFKDFQFTEVLGPFWIDDTRLLVGFWADRLRGAQPERRVTCKLYGGTLVTDGWVNFAPQPRYNFQSTLAHGDLARFTQEAVRGRQPLAGEILANVELRGKGSSVNDLGGRGNIQLRNGDIYQLPLMVSLLKVLGIRAPDATGFTKSDIDFRIEGEHIYVDRIDLNGDVVSLLGKGEVGLNKQIHLTFHAMVGPNEMKIPLLHELVGGASRQIMLIHAEGTMDQPALRREAFPGVNQALQQLQAELQPRESSPGLATPVGPTGIGPDRR